MQIAESLTASADIGPGNPAYQHLPVHEGTHLIWTLKILWKGKKVEIAPWLSEISSATQYGEMTTCLYCMLAKR